MQHTQFNYKIAASGVLLLVSLGLATTTAFSQGIAARGKPNPILTSSQNGPCDPALDQAELVSGTDVDGNPVAPANLPSAPLPLKGRIDVPLKTQPGQAPGYVTVEGGKLDPLLNPKSACR